MLSLCIFGFLLFIPSISLSAVDINQPLSASTYQCFRNNDYLLAIVQAVSPVGLFDPNAISNLNNARAAGLITEIYMSLCRGKSASAQVDQMMTAISSNMYGMVWVKVQVNPNPGCGWGTDYNENCDYLREAIQRVKSQGKVAGVYASRSVWTAIMGSVTACGAAAEGGQALWYVNYDGKASFNDFKAFGGWSNPNLKQFQGNASVCGVNVNKNFYHFYA